MELRLAGFSLVEIGRTMNMDPAGVGRAIGKAMENRLSPIVDELRMIMNERYEQMISGIWQNAITGDVTCIDRVLKILKQQAELNGLNVIPQPSKNMEIGQVIWQAPLSEARKESLEGRIRHIQDNTISTNQTPDSESSLAELDGEKTLLPSKTQSLSEKPSLESESLPQT